MLHLRALLFICFGIFVGCSPTAEEKEQPATPEEPKVETPAPKPVDSEKSILERAKKIHEEAITLDSHVDIPGANYATEEMDPGVDNPELRCDLVKMKKGEMDGVFLAVFVSQQPKYDKGTYKKIKADAHSKFDAIHRIFKMYPDRCEWAKNADDMERIEKSGKKAIAIGIENGYPIGDDIKNLKEFYDRGARYITLSHGRHNQICDSSRPDKPKHNGLSDFGKEVVAEMNRLGIMCDASHISVKSFNDLIELTKAPIIASHSGCYALNQHDRNLTDEQLRALKKNGGVIQIVALGSFLKKEPAEYTEAVEALKKEVGVPNWWEYDKMSKAERDKIKPKLEIFWTRRAEIRDKMAWVGLKDFVDHIDYAVKIAGIDHVGIGTDFDGGAGIPGFNNHSEALNVTIELVKRGYSDEDIKKIWGGNLLRVWREVERVAKSLQEG